MNKIFMRTNTTRGSPSARKTMTFQFVRAVERRVNPIHKLGLKPVAAAADQGTIDQPLPL